LFQSMTIMMAEAVTVASAIPASTVLLSAMMYLVRHEEVKMNVGVSETK
jgi:hypothetical protein